jgi:hypothetical protein
MKRVGLPLEATEGSADTYVRKRHATKYTVTMADLKTASLRDVCNLRQLKPPKRTIWIRGPIPRAEIPGKGSHMLWNRKMLYSVANGYWKSYRSRREHIELPIECLARQITFGITFTHHKPAADIPGDDDIVDRICKLIVRIDSCGLDNDERWSLYTTKVIIHVYWNGRQGVGQDLAGTLKIPASTIPHSHHATAPTGTTRKDVVHAILSLEDVEGRVVLVLNIDVRKDGTSDKL